LTRSNDASEDKLLTIGSLKRRFEWDEGPTRGLGYSARGIFFIRAISVGRLDNARVANTLGGELSQRVTVDALVADKVLRDHVVLVVLVVGLLGRLGASDWLPAIRQQRFTRRLANTAFRQPHSGATAPKDATRKRISDRGIAGKSRCFLPSNGTQSASLLILHRVFCAPPRALPLCHALSHAFLSDGVET
jgi:hypothetical protein